MLPVLGAKQYNMILCWIFFMTTVMCYICWTNLLNTQEKTDYHRNSRSNIVSISLINVKVQIQTFFDDYPITEFAKKCLLLSCTSIDWLMDENTPLANKLNNLCWAFLCRNNFLSAPIQKILGSTEDYSIPTQVWCLSCVLSCMASSLHSFK